MSGGGGQEVVQTGPSVQAAQMAAQAQVQSTEAATQASEANTNSAIQAMMGEYTTSLGIEQPIIDYGNSAAGQLNYMLGLAPAPLPTAPTAPTAPTLAQAEAGITSGDINSYISSNTTVGPYGIAGYGGALGPQAPNPGTAGAGIGSGGAANAWENANPTDYFSGGAGPAGDGATGTLLGLQSIESNPGIQAGATAALGEQALNNPNSTIESQYTTAEDLYNQQLTEYNNELPIAQNYQNLGQATGADISNIVTQLPGYQFQQQQGVNTLQNAASASGMLNSSNLLEQLNEFGQQLGSSYYQNYLTNLQGLAGLGASVSSQAASSANTNGQSIASLDSQLGTNEANAALAAGQAQASSYLSPVANQTMSATQVGGGGSSGLGSILGGVGGLLGSIL